MSRIIVPIAFFVLIFLSLGTGVFLLVSSDNRREEEISVLKEKLSKAEAELKQTKDVAAMWEKTSFEWRHKAEDLAAEIHRIHKAKIPPPKMVELH